MTPNSAVRCLSARVSAAVNPANNATFPIGSIVVQRVAKSLLILIRSGDMRVLTPLHERAMKCETKLESRLRDVTREMFIRRLPPLVLQSAVSGPVVFSSALYERRFKREPEYSPYFIILHSCQILTSAFLVAFDRSNKPLSDSGKLF